MQIKATTDIFVCPFPGYLDIVSHPVFTPAKEVLGKIMFLYVFVILSTGVGRTLYDVTPCLAA